MSDIIINSVTNINTNDAVITFILQIVTFSIISFTLPCILGINTIEKLRDILK